MITELLNQVHEQNQPEVCTLNNYEPYKFTEAGKEYTLASVTQAGRVARIKVYKGAGQKLTDAQIGQELTFNLKSYAGGNNIYISGFWNDRASPQISQQPQQAPQQAAQPTNSPPSMEYAPALEIFLRIATALEKIAAKGESFEQKYKLGEDPDFPKQPGNTKPESEYKPI